MSGRWWGQQIRHGMDMSRKFITTLPSRVSVVLMFIYWKISFKTMQLETQCPLTRLCHRRSFSCCMSFSRDRKHWCEMFFRAVTTECMRVTRRVNFKWLNWKVERVLRRNFFHFIWNNFFLIFFKKQLWINFPTLVTIQQFPFYATEICKLGRKLFHWEKSANFRWRKKINAEKTTWEVDLSWETSVLVCNEWKSIFKQVVCRLNGNWRRINCEASTSQTFSEMNKIFH